MSLRLKLAHRCELRLCQVHFLEPAFPNFERGLVACALPRMAVDFGGGDGYIEL